jgi:hypothetical protein
MEQKESVQDVILGLPCLRRRHRALSQALPLITSPAPGTFGLRGFSIRLGWGGNG